MHENVNTAITNINRIEAVSLVNIDSAIAAVNEEVLNITNDIATLQADVTFLEDTTLADISGHINTIEEKVNVTDQTVNTTLTNLNALIS